MTFRELTKTYKRPYDRIIHMSNMQIVICVFGMFMFMLIASLIIFPMTKGMPVIGLPAERNIAQVEVTNTHRDDPVVVTDDADLIYVARDAAGGYLNYVWAKEEVAPAGEDFYLTVKYIAKDGTEKELSVSDNYVYWNGYYHKLMKPGVFASWIEAGFYDKTLIIER